MKNIVLIITIFILSILLVGTAYILKNDEICCKYKVCRQLTDICVEDQSDIQVNKIISVKNISITLDNLNSGDKVISGYEVKGSVTGSWFFEGSFPVKILDREGDVLGTVIARTDEDWMTEEEVSFSLVLDIDLEEESVLILKFMKSNPSALEENDDYAQMSITIEPEDNDKDILTVKIFFPNDKINSEMLDCSLVFPVSREIPETVAVARATLTELFNGLTEDELDEGYFTNIPEGVEMQSLSIEEGVASVDFNTKLEEGIGGSCRVNSIRAQIEETLKQFESVDSVVISIDGRTEDILQP